MNCPLCAIVTGRERTPFEQLFPTLTRDDQVIARDADCLAVVDVAPIARGHCLVIPEHHHRSWAEADASEFQSAKHLVEQLTSFIEQHWSTDSVVFEHGQRDEQVHPYGCSIVHAHLHVVSRFVKIEGVLASLEGVTFRALGGGLDSLPNEVGMADYLYVDDLDGEAWVATPRRTKSQLLRRAFLEADFSNSRPPWNWNDQLMMADALATRQRVINNLDAFRDLGASRRSTESNGTHAARGPR